MGGVDGGRARPREKTPLRQRSPDYWRVFRAGEVGEPAPTGLVHEMKRTTAGWVVERLGGSSGRDCRHLGLSLWPLRPRPQAGLLWAGYRLALMGKHSWPWTKRKGATGGTERWTVAPLDGKGAARTGVAWARPSSVRARRGRRRPTPKVAVSWPAAPMSGDGLTGRSVSCAPKESILGS